MNEYEMNEHGLCKRNKWWKYLGIILATLTGSFFAFYFAVSCTISYLMSPAYAMKRMDKIDRMAMRDFNDFDKEMNHPKGMVFQHKSAVEFIKTPDAYKFIVDLTPFQGNADAVNVEVKDNIITINGESSSNTKNTETFTKMSQTYSLSPKANIDKLSKKKVDNKYIITVPIED